MKYPKPKRELSLPQLKKKVHFTVTGTSGTTSVFEDKGLSGGRIFGSFLKPKRRVKSERKRLIERLDKEMSIMVRNRDKKCVMCGSVKQLGAGHVLPKGIGATRLRWDVRNVFAQCWAHNYAHVRDQYPYIQWFINSFGQDMLDDLERERHIPAKFTNQELKDMLQDFKEANEKIT